VRQCQRPSCCSQSCNPQSSCPVHLLKHVDHESIIIRWCDQAQSHPVFQAVIRSQGYSFRMLSIAMLSLDPRFQNESLCGGRCCFKFRATLQWPNLFDTSSPLHWHGSSDHEGLVLHKGYPCILGGRMHFASCRHARCIIHSWRPCMHNYR
jgi:hypothetical protein